MRLTWKVWESTGRHRAQPARPIARLSDMPVARYRHDDRRVLRQRRVSGIIRVIDMTGIPSARHRVGVEPGTELPVILRQHLVQDLGNVIRGSGITAMFPNSASPLDGWSPPWEYRRPRTGTFVLALTASTITAVLDLDRQCERTAVR